MITRDTSLQDVMVLCTNGSGDFVSALEAKPILAISMYITVQMLSVYIFVCIYGNFLAKNALLSLQ